MEMNYSRQGRKILSSLPGLPPSLTISVPALKRWAIFMFGVKRQKVQQLDFIVPGAQKSGTTALHHFLSKHPQIALPDRQELHFFDGEAVFARQPVDYELLHGHFGPVASSSIAGEVTPSYFYW